MCVNNDEVHNNGNKQIIYLYRYIQNTCIFYLIIYILMKNIKTYPNINRKNKTPIICTYVYATNTNIFFCIRERILNKTHYSPRH